MPPRGIRAVFVDDNRDERRRLEGLGRIPGITSLVTPPQENYDIQHILSLRADVVVIDHQLHEQQEDGTCVEYRGATLASVLRDKLPETPILLLSRRSLLGSGHLASAKDLASSYDDLLFKDDAFDNKKAFVQALRTIVAGYQALVKCQKRSWPGLRNALGAKREEGEILLQADPPRSVLENRSWRAAEVAGWIRKTLVRYPGILYDALHAGVLLGIDEKAFTSSTVQRFFSKARYGGPFAPASGLWWKRRVLLRAYTLMHQAGIAPGIPQRFPEAWREKRGTKLKPSVCVSSGESPADTVCYVYRKPVMRRQSLPYHPDTRPAPMDEARISFKAIKETNEYDEWLFPPDARVALKRIQHGE